MSKTINATCSVGVVKNAEGQTIPETELMSEGVGASAGIAIFDENSVFYIPKTTPDLKATLENLVTALNEASSGLTASGSGISGLVPFTSNPIAAAAAIAGSLASISSAAAAVSSVATVLDELKDNLR